MAQSSVISRIFQNVEKNGLFERWEWRGTKSDKGYGRVELAGKHRKVHRVVWEYYRQGDFFPQIHVYCPCLTHKIKKGQRGRYVQLWGETHIPARG